MPFVQIDPLKIQFDAPQQPRISGGFVQVDPSKIQFDAPQLQNQNLLEKIGSSDLGSAVGDVIDQTGNIIKNIPNQNPASSGLQIAGQGAKLISAPMGQAISAVTPDALRTGAQSTADAIDSTNIGQMLGDKLLQARNYYDQFTQSHPEIASDIGAGMNIASTLQGGQAATNAVNDLKGVVSNASNGAKGLAEAYAAKYPEGTAPFDPIPENIKYPLSSDAIETAAKLRYANADALGGQIRPQGVNDTIDRIMQTSGYQTPEGVAFAGENPVTDTIRRLNSLRNKPISLQGLDEIDGRLQSDISKSFRVGDNESASQLMSIRDALRNARSTVKPTDLINPEAFNEWRSGDILWAAKSKMQDIQSMLDDANMTDNPATAMRTGSKNLAKRLNKNSMGYTQEEIDTVNKGAKGSLAVGALKTLGGRLMSGFIGGAAGGAAGGIPGAFIGAAKGEMIGYPMRKAANAIQQSRSSAPLSMIADRPAVVAAIPQSVSEIIKLPMAQQKAALDALFDAQKLKLKASP